MKKNITNDDIAYDSIYELPEYNPIVANAIYKRNFQFERMYICMEHYCEKIGKIDENGEIVKNHNFDVNSLKSEVEKFIFLLLDREEQQNDKEKFEKMIEKELKERGFVTESKVKNKTTKFLGAIDRLWEWGEKNKKERNIKYYITQMLVWILFFIMLKSPLIYLAMLVMIIIVFMQIKTTEITLTLKGKEEREKLKVLVKYLKNKTELSEDEEYFLCMLNKL